VRTSTGGSSSLSPHIGAELPQEVSLMPAPQLLQGVLTAGSSRPSPPEVRNIQSDHDRRDRAKPPAPSSEGRRGPWRRSRPRCVGRDAEAGRSATGGGPWSAWNRSSAVFSRRSTPRGRWGRPPATTTRAGKCRMSSETARVHFARVNGQNRVRDQSRCPVSSSMPPE
jgi:hypothetical protein